MRHCGTGYGKCSKIIFLLPLSMGCGGGKEDEVSDRENLNFMTTMIACSVVRNPDSSPSPPCDLEQFPRPPRRHLPQQSLHVLIFSTKQCMGQPRWPVTLSLVLEEWR